MSTTIAELLSSITMTEVCRSHLCIPLTMPWHSTLNQVLVFLHQHKQRFVLLVDDAHGAVLLSILDCLICLNQLEILSALAEPALKLFNAQLDAVLLGSDDSVNFALHAMSSRGRVKPAHELLILDKDRLIRSSAFVEFKKPENEYFALDSIDLIEFLLNRTELESLTCQTLAQCALVSEQVLKLCASNKSAAEDPAMESGGEEDADAYARAAPAAVASPPLQIFYVTTAQRALDAFTMMVQFRIQSLPVIHATTQQLETTISSSDFLGINASTIDALSLPIPVYLEQRNGSKAERDRMSWLLNVVANPHATLQRVMKQLVENRVHRVWVLDSARRPVAVVSASDIFAFFDSDKSKATISKHDESATSASVGFKSEH